MIDQPGTYDIRDDIYHADPVVEPSLNSSVAKLFIEKTPMHAREEHPRLNPKREPENRKVYDIGKAAHRLILGKGAELRVLEFKDYRTDAAKAARAAAYRDNVIPVLAKEAPAVKDMVDAVRLQLAHHEDAPEAFLPGYGVAEQVIVWREQPNPKLPPVWCRSMLDWTPLSGNVLSDFKSTETNPGPNGWGGKTMFDTGAAFQWAFYRRGKERLTDRSWHLQFIVAETSRPYACAVHQPSKLAGDGLESDVEEAIRQWQWCMAHGKWPGWSSRTYGNDEPRYRSMTRESRKIMEIIDRDNGRDTMARAMMFQAPPGLDMKKLPIQPSEAA